MRKPATVLLALAATALPGALAAQVPSAEVELHIEATAQVMPDRAVATFTLNGRGDNLAAASAQLAKQQKALIGTLGALGIPASSLNRIDSPSPKLTPVPVPMAVAPSPPPVKVVTAQKTPGPVQVAFPPPPVISETASATYRLDVEDISKLPGLEAALARESLVYGRLKTTFQTLDPDKAYAKARSDALAKARAEAEGYAAALGYKVVRLVRVSNARPQLSTHDLLGALAGLDSRQTQPGMIAASTVETVALDYVIAPK